MPFLQSLSLLGRHEGKAIAAQRSVCGIKKGGIF